MDWFLYDRNFRHESVKEKRNFFLLWFFVHRSAHKFFSLNIQEVSIFVVFLGAVFHLMFLSIYLFKQLFNVDIYNS